MCILFFCQSEIWQPGGYRLIIANNRDELWDRPTKSADFWHSDQSCISSLDMLPGREGGTWMGLNKNGKVGVLLNILGQQSPNKAGRGMMVSDYLTGTENLEEYGANIHEKRDEYNGFNLILFDVGRQEENLSVKPLYITNSAHYHSCVSMRNLPSNTFFGVSNSPLEYPFKKVEHGKEQFGKVVRQFPLVHSKDHLIHNLLGLLQDRSPFLPDPVLEEAGILSGFSPLRLEQHSAINVHSPAQRYGSRTSTVLLIDGEGQVDYVEQNTIYRPDRPEGVDSETTHKIFSLHRVNANL